MPKQRWVVRVVHSADECERKPTIGLLVECFRYAGYVQLQRKEDGLCWDLLPPPGNTDTQEWAYRNAERMQSLGLNAAAGPECP